MNVQLARVLTLVALVATLSACQKPAPPAAATPEAPDYFAILGPTSEQFITVWNTQNYEVLDAILAPDFHRKAPDQNVSNLAEMKDFVKQVHAAYPDFHVETDSIAYTRDHAFVKWTATGTNTGDGATKATGKPIKVEGMTLLTFRDGRIIEEDVFFDSAALSAQLGTTAMPHAKKEM